MHFSILTLHCRFCPEATMTTVLPISMRAVGSTSWRSLPDMVNSPAWKDMIVFDLPSLYKECLYVIRKQCCDWPVNNTTRCSCTSRLVSWRRFWYLHCVRSGDGIVSLPAVNIQVQSSEFCMSTLWVHQSNSTALVVESLHYKLYAIAKVIGWSHSPLTDK